MLVRRVPQGAVLTDAGQLLVERAEAILAHLDDVEAELQTLAGVEGGRLRLASFASAASSIVPLAIARFRERYPAVELSIAMADPVDSLPRLRAGELDMALSHDPMSDTADERSVLTAPAEGGGNGRPGGIELVHLFDDPMYVAMPVGHPLADLDPLDLASFANEAWMLATTNTCPDSPAVLASVSRRGIRTADRVSERRLSRDPRVRRRRSGRGDDSRHGHPRRSRGRRGPVTGPVAAAAPNLRRAAVWVPVPAAAAMLLVSARSATPGFPTAIPSSAPDRRRPTSRRRAVRRCNPGRRPRARASSSWPQVRPRSRHRCRHHLPRRAAGRRVPRTTIPECTWVSASRGISATPTPAATSP